ncbi:cytochrome c family protein [Sphingopyxis sp. JAI128]|uniref:c-type cytochrome n=1 Tax=Sphingopyxis sp. JAI128 TaxID=2723066 RepID=UPI001614A8DE|nr:cytochrome c family protein [Sphingopyxis sp. JAI128]MBB6427411.1 cytochrome c [Sphingopyxis sp. JAI128]
MDNRNNTIAGWVLFAGICALGLTIGSSMLFASHAPEKPGYPIEDAEAGAGGGESAVPLANLLAAADPAKGEAVFAKCAACHTINSGGANGIGPNLFGALGKTHGHVPGFAYSDALKSVPGNWDFEGMNAWLTSPRKYAPGTKMSFAGLSSPEDRANLIVYMNTQGSNLPLPAPEAAPAAAEGTAAAEGDAAAPAAEGAAAPAADAAAAAPSPAEAKK